MRTENTEVTEDTAREAHPASTITTQLKEINQALKKTTTETNNDVALDNLKHMRNYIVHLQELTSTLEEAHQSIRTEWTHHTDALKQSIRKINEQFSRIQNRYEEIAASKDELIMKQKRELKVKNLMYMALKKLRSVVRPKIGTFYQYSDSTPIGIPKHYYTEAMPAKPMSIAVVTPSYNQGGFIEKTILSVLEQNYPSLEYVIQDGGSNDQTVAVIKKYANKIKHWESKPDDGQSNAINLGFGHTTDSDIMAYLNSDDILLPGTLAYVSKYFAAHPDVDVVYGHRIVIDEYDHEIGRWVMPKHNSEVLSWVDYVPQETLFWRRSIWNKIGGNIDENFRFALDWDLILRFRDAGAKFVRLPRFLGAFRVHSEQKTSAQINKIGVKEMQELRKRCHGRYVAGTEIKKHIRPYQIQHILLDKLYRMGILRY